MVLPLISTIKIRQPTFNGIYNIIHNHFKGLEYKYGVSIKWNAITFKTVIIKSKGKSIKNCL